MKRADLIGKLEESGCALSGAVENTIGTAILKQVLRNRWLSSGALL